MKKRKTIKNLKLNTIKQNSKNKQRSKNERKSKNDSLKNVMTISIASSYENVEIDQNDWEKRSIIFNIIIIKQIDLNIKFQLIQNNSNMKHIVDMWSKCEKGAKIIFKIICVVVRKFISNMKIKLIHYQFLIVFVVIKLNDEINQQHEAMIENDFDFDKINILTFDDKFLQIDFVFI